MQLKIDRNDASRISSLSWDEIVTGVRNKWLDPGVAVDFAIKQLECGASESCVLDLAACDYDDTIGIQNNLDQIEKRMSHATFDNSKWALIILTIGYEHQSQLADPLQFVEEIYADFEYPQVISHLVRYMPSEGPPRNLMEDWKHLIDSVIYDVLISRNPKH